MAGDIRILFLADSHIGFDLPVKARIARRRRGHDFLANYAAALEPALRGEVDLVVHGGDVFDRSRVATSVAYQAFEPLRRVADARVPVFIVPGNHERSRMPHARFASHPNIHVFERPRTFVAEVRGTRVAFGGFPYERHNVRAQFANLLDATGCRSRTAALRLLCMHHCVEGATVGPGNFVFTTADDVIRTRDLPRDFAVVLTGHIHRHQVLTTDRSGRALETPVLYPGSIERTSLAEIDEPKGYMLVNVAESEGDFAVRWEFRRLPVRPMMRHDVSAEGMASRQLEDAVRGIVADAPADAVLSIRVTGELTDAQRRALSAARIRQFVPETMNVDIRPAGGYVAPSRRLSDEQLSLEWAMSS
jgi:DNA repair exonuclease SbcCD nuclease subunit